MARTDARKKMAVRTAYIVQRMTSEECSEAFDVHPTTVKTWASKEGWTAERDRRTTDATGVVVDELHNAVAEACANHIKASDRILETVTILADKLVELVKLEPTEDNKSGARYLRSLIESGKSLGEMADKVIGIGRLSRGLRPGDASVPETVSDQPFAFFVEEQTAEESQTA
jgi:hypothetical protein